jgi:peptidyl-prolyl cis-trans isomerase SurA
MNRICILAISLCAGLICSSIQAQPVFTYGNMTVSKEEFLRAYNKSKTTGDDREKSIREYVDLYANFKMKVKEAFDMKLDTTDQYKGDVQNFRRQIAENYLIDEPMMNRMMQEAFERSQYDLHIVRYSVAMEDGADPSDTLLRYQAIQELIKSWSTGKSLDEISINPLVNTTDMGFITAFSLPYVYENMVYALKEGGYTAPYRSKRSWNVFRLVKKRPAAGKWKVAQILLTMPPDADVPLMKTIQKKADSIYALLQQGADFAGQARLCSDDKLTYLNGGELPEFGTGKYDAAFESYVHAMKKDGDIAPPFSTSFGFHILKRLGFTPIPADPRDEAFQYELKQKILQDDRIRMAKESFSRDVMRRISLKPTNAVKKEDLFRFADTVIIRFKEPELTKQTAISQKTIFTHERGKLTGADWLRFVLEYKNNPELYSMETNEQLWTLYQTFAPLEVYKEQLEVFNSNFGFQMQEFREGNLLFEIMEKRIWNKASEDSLGLLNHYEANKSNYRWNASADMIVVNAVTEEMAAAAKTELERGVNWRDLLEANQGEIQADSGRFELAQVNGDSTATPGSYSKVINHADGTAGFIYYIQFYPENDQRKFEDAKGLVINEYQMILEKRWVEALRKKYPVSVNEGVLKSIIRAD